MLKDAAGIKKIYIACGYTNLRMGIDAFRYWFRNSSNLTRWNRERYFCSAADVVILLRVCFLKGMDFSFSIKGWSPDSVFSGPVQ